jgi:predicted DNA-binding protein
VREAIVNYLEDNEDLNLAHRALSKSGQQKSLKEIKIDLGLDS